MSQQRSGKCLEVSQLIQIIKMLTKTCNRTVKTVRETNAS